MQRAKRIQKGFTLLEILLVIAAIGLLAAIILVAINPNRQLAQVRNAERRSEVNTIYKALEQYLIDKGSYPTGITTSIQDICINGNTTNCVNLGVLVPDYIAAIPIDPGGGAYRVVINTSNNRVSIYASNAELGQGIGINDRPWTPANISTALWLDAADTNTITLNGSTVSQWNDKSGNTRNFSQATATNQPVYSTNALNGKNVINFASADSLTRTTAIPFNDLGNNSLYIVGNRTGRTGSYNVALVIMRAVQRSRNILFEFGSGNAGKWGTYTNTDVPSPLGNIGANYKISEMIVDQATNTYLFYQDGTSQGSNGSVNTNIPFNTTTSYIGNDQNNAWLEGNVAEVIFCDEKNSDADRQLIEGYLAWKWGLTNNLPANHPYKWNGAEFGGVNITDTDAQTYIAAVETADGQSLENNTRLAIQNFIVGAKADGIWDAIKSSNILAGARTLNGALVPLKGTAPTNFNFVSGDYNRKTGLVGNGSTKYLDTNRNNNADPQNSSHNFVQASTIGSGKLIATLLGTAVGANGLSTSDIFNRYDNTAFVAFTAVAGGVGHSRNSATEFTYINNKLLVNKAANSANRQDSGLLVFRGGLQYSTARLAFYSIGESLDLAQLDTRVTKLMTDLGNAIP
jgi:prepilin-type N-terminal cleavage/methylation domain-containing protein